MDTNMYTGCKISSVRAILKSHINTLYILLGTDTSMYYHMHAIMQIVNTILWYIIPCFLHLLMLYKICRQVDWVKYLVFHTCSKDMYGEIEDLLEYIE